MGDSSQVCAVFWLLPMHFYEQCDNRYKSAWEIAALLKDNEARWMPHLEIGKDGLRFKREKSPLKYELDILCMHTVVIHSSAIAPLPSAEQCYTSQGASMPRTRACIDVGLFFVVPLHLGTFMNGYNCGYNTRRLSGAVQTIREPYTPWW